HEAHPGSLPWQLLRRSRRFPFVFEKRPPCPWSADAIHPRAKHGAFWHVFVMITVSRVDSSVRRIRRTRELSGEQSRYHLLCMKVNKK
ncbi:MAG: hypothetical protein JSW15_08470, partial [Deltaproteobacteria bacterium]